MINLFGTIFNEEAFYQVAILEKQGGLNKEEKIQKMLPIIAQQMDKVVAQVPSHRPTNYYKVEGKVNKKFKKIIREVKSYAFRASLNWNKMD